MPRKSSQSSATEMMAQVEQQCLKTGASDSEMSEEQCHPRKLFIGGLAHKTTTQQLRDHFARHGAIVDAVVLRWPDGRSRGFGYVTFADVSAASSAVQRQHRLGGRVVDVKRAVPGTNKLFVGGLPQNSTSQELRDYFENFGVVSDTVVMIDPATGRSRGFGFVCFLPGQEGSVAVASALDQYENHRIRGKWIEVKSAAPPHKVDKTGMKSDPPTPPLAGHGSPASPSLLPQGFVGFSSSRKNSEDSTGAELLAAAAAAPLHPGGRPLARPLRQGDTPSLASLGSPRKVSLSAVCSSAPTSTSGGFGPPPGLGSGSVASRSASSKPAEPMTGSSEMADAGAWSARNMQPPWPTTPFAPGMTPPQLQAMMSAMAVLSGAGLPASNRMYNYGAPAGAPGYGGAVPDAAAMQLLFRQCMQQSMATQAAAAAHAANAMRPASGYPGCFGASAPWQFADAVPTPEVSGFSKPAVGAIHTTI